MAAASNVEVTMSVSMARPKTCTVGCTPTDIVFAAYSVFTAVPLDSLPPA